jgi:hypothetical protein
MKNPFENVRISNILITLSFFGMLCIIGGFVYREYDEILNPPPLKEYNKGIQNHLVWNIKGECYFVRPYNDTTMYLIKTPDCDKGGK